MAFTGFQLLLAAVSALAGLAAVALPVRAADEQPVPALSAPRITDVPDRELSDRLSPAETPPPDFTAAQYIDSAGCVFLRTGQGWRARVARDGAPICGYPPTLSARRLGPDSAALFAKADEPPAERIHRELTEAIIPNLHEGELIQGADAVPEVAGATHGHSGAGSPTGADGPAAQEGTGRPPQDPLGLGEMMSHAPELSRQMTRTGHTDRLCALIGSAPQDAAASPLGLCRPATATLAALAQPATRDPVRTIRPSAAQAGYKPAREETRQASRNPVKRNAVAAKPRPDAAARRTAEAPRDAQGMIPPDARYVQIGAFRDLQGVERTARALTALGLPVVRSRSAHGQAQLIMVGPLDGREAIVRMIDRLRRAGYRDVVARR